MFTNQCITLETSLSLSRQEKTWNVHLSLFYSLGLWVQFYYKFRARNGFHSVLILFDYDMEFVIDVQGFKKAYNEFVFKELAVVPLGEDVQPTVYLFGPPHDWNFLAARYKCENNWLTRNYHGINWQDGEIPYEEFEEILKSSVRGASKIYVKGLEKQKWLQNIISRVCNIEDLDCPSLTKLHGAKDIPCSHHNLHICKNSNCAVINAIALKRWLLNFHNAFTFYKDKTLENSDIDY